MERTREILVRRAATEKPRLTRVFPSFPKVTFKKLRLKIINTGAGEMIQWLRVLVALAEDLGSEDLGLVPNTHSSKGSKALFWPPRVLHTHVAHTHVQANSRTL